MVLSTHFRRFFETQSTILLPLAAGSAITVALATNVSQNGFIATQTSIHKSSLEAHVESYSRDNQEQRPRLIFLGTGSSTGCPKPICIMKMHQDNNQATTENGPSDALCNVSLQAIKGDPKNNKNYRNNPSLLIQHYDSKSENYKNIVIDVGKTFRETALRWFPKYGISSLDAIILTHHHMDAAGGLDDVRGFQSIKWVEDPPKKGEHNESTGADPLSPTSRPVRAPLPLYLSDFCRLNLQSQFPWLLPRPEIVMPQQDQDRPYVERDVASFNVVEFQNYTEIKLQFEDANDADENGGFKVIPLPVWHGDDLISHGYAFTVQPNSSLHKPLNVLYISDISTMVPETLDFIQKQLPPTDVLIVDSLLPYKPHPVHFSLEQAVDLADRIQPRLQTYLIGMSCDAFLPHDEMNAYLYDRYGGKVTMAHDGLVIDLPAKSEQEIKRETLHETAEKQDVLLRVASL
ncbi:beta-lactamase-like protein [Nitzschia inconspicua]|uniref:Beta-lactamase-like protein n=1 Tax=Nitzschia inconspicua TaxID=303405 RepID=A0A9K3LJN1_9STRA|nr:beta-lactamase-like protein [Nitzschia inconspicua]